VSEHATRREEVLARRVAELEDLCEDLRRALRQLVDDFGRTSERQAEEVAALRAQLQERSP